MFRLLCLISLLVNCSFLNAQKRDVFIRYASGNELNDSVIIEFEVTVPQKCVCLYEELILVPFLSGSNQTIQLGAISIKSRGLRNIEARDATLENTSQTMFTMGNSEQLSYRYAVSMEKWMANASLILRKEYKRNTRFVKQDQLLLMERVFQTNTNH